MVRNTDSPASREPQIEPYRLIGIGRYTGFQYVETRAMTIPTEPMGVFLEVLQLCSHPVVGWQDAPPGIFGLWSIQVATI